MQELERQQNALVEFHTLIDHAVPYFAWYEGVGPEPAEFKRWRLCASIVYRCELWQACGLPRVPGLLRILFTARLQKRAAYKEWLKVKRALSADFIAGRSQIRPPWGTNLTSRQ